jgi:hypothetical protein
LARRSTAEAVGTAAFSFTASTSFANPAVTLAGSLTETFAGIRMFAGELGVLRARSVDRMEER